MRTRIDNYINRETLEMEYGVSVSLNGKEWVLLAEKNKPLLFATLAEAEAERKLWRRSPARATKLYRLIERMTPEEKAKVWGLAP